MNHQDLGFTPEETIALEQATRISRRPPASVHPSAAAERFVAQPPGHFTDAELSRAAAFTGHSLTDLLGTRRSRALDLGPVDRVDLARLLSHSARLANFGGNEEGQWQQRPYPSAGGTHSISLYVDVTSVSMMPAGFYRFNPATCQLESIGSVNVGQLDRLRQAARTAARRSEPAPVTIYLLADPRPLTLRYEAALTLLMRDSGACSATLHLMATDLDLASCILGVAGQIIHAGETTLICCGALILGAPLPLKGSTPRRLPRPRLRSDVLPVGVLALTGLLVPFVVVFLLPAALVYCLMKSTSTRARGARFGKANELSLELVAAMVLLPTQGLLAGLGANLSFYFFAAGNMLYGATTLAGTLLISYLILRVIVTALADQKTGRQVNPFEPGVDPVAGIHRIDEELAQRAPRYLPARHGAALSWAERRPWIDYGSSRSIEQPSWREAAAILKEHQAKTHERSQTATLLATTGLSTLVLTFIAFARHGDGWSAGVLAAVFSVVGVTLTWLSSWIARLADVRDRSRRFRDLLLRRADLVEGADRRPDIEVRVAAVDSKLNQILEALGQEST